MPTKSHLPNHLDSIRTKLRPKHQVLITKCYPRLPKNSSADVKPNGSELSYLLYYASTRRSKLDKVGTFLEKKTASDVGKWQSARVAVTLQILTALLENKGIGSSSAGFPLFAPYVLRILREILQGTNDVSLIEASLVTWDTFARHQDQTTLAADAEYRELYQDVVGRYAALAKKNGAKSLSKGGQSVAVQDEIRLRKAGLGALKSVLSSDALASEVGRQLDVVIPAVLSNLRGGPNGDTETYLEHLERLQESFESDEKQRAMDRRQSMATVRTSTSLAANNRDDADPRQAAGSAQDADNLSNEEAAVLALECLRATFATDNRPQLKTATTAVLRFMTHVEHIWFMGGKSYTDEMVMDRTWPTKLYEMCTGWTAVQDRFVVMVTTVEIMVRVPLEEPKMREHLLYTALIQRVLQSELNLIGLSVMDILLSLIQQVLRVLHIAGPRLPGRNSAAQIFASDEEEQQPRTVEATAAAGVDKPSWERVMLTRELKACIADLGTHVYYTDQITDMLSAILMRLKPNPTTIVGQQNPLATAAAIEEPQSAIIETASNVSISARHRAGTTSGQGFFSFETARQFALEAAREILILANNGGTRASLPAIHTISSNAKPDTRHKVPLAIWEGTQWLLRDPSPEVRRAYVDALTTWLRLETTRKDARIAQPKQKTPKKESVVARRALSSASRKGRGDGVMEGQGKKVTNTFLSLLHLAIYEDALQYAGSASPEAEKEMAMLHLLLNTLVKRLGVNAVQSGLPTIFALQDEVHRAGKAEAKVRLGGLVLGYFWNVVDNFELDITPIGREIFSEVSQRRERGVWTNEIIVPPMDMRQIAALSASTSITLHKDQHVELTDFTARKALVDAIADAYDNTIQAMSPPTSAPGSPGRSIKSPALHRSNSSYLSAKQPPTQYPRLDLPEAVKKTMLEPWTKESCLAAIAANMPKSASVSGSRSSPPVPVSGQGQSLMQGLSNHRQLLSAAGGSPANRSRNTSIPRQRRRSTPSTRDVNGGRMGTSSSSVRKGTVRVEELKRILDGDVSVDIRLGSSWRNNDGDETASESMVEGSQSSGLGTPSEGEHANGHAPSAVKALLAGLGGEGEGRKGGAGVLGRVGRPEA